MKNGYYLMILAITILSCGSPKTINQSKQINHYFLKSEAIYSELLEDNSITLYCFYEPDNTVYYTKITKSLNDTVINTKKIELKTSIYGRYKTVGNIIKLQKNIFKTIKYKGKYTFNILYMFIPVRLSAPMEIEVVDKEVITEGEIKKDTILLVKSYLGTKKFEYKKKILSKTKNKKSVLLYEPKLKGIITENKQFNSYTLKIVSK